jgi:hypothetical protein
MDVVFVDVFPPHHLTYLRRDSVMNLGNMCIILVVGLILPPPPSSDLRTKSVLTIDTPDVVENIIGGIVLIIGVVGVEKCSSKGHFGSHEPQAHDRRNRSCTMHRFIL